MHKLNVAAAALLLLSLLGPIGCGDQDPVGIQIEPDTSAAFTHEQAPRMVGGSIYRANAFSWEVTPPKLWVSASVADSLQRLTAIPECALGVQVANASGDVWRSLAQPVGSCRASESQRQFDVRAILGDSMPAGRYAVSALLQVNRSLVEVPAGIVFLYHDSRPPIRDRSGLRYSVVSGTDEIAPTYLNVAVTMSNVGDRRVKFEYGACILNLRAYRTADRSGTPAWRSEQRRPPGSNNGYACLAYLASKTISPGETFSPGEFRARIPLYEFFGADSLPDGRYYFTAELTLFWDTVKVVNGSTYGDLRPETIKLNAGELQLSSRKDPPPASRTIDGIQYTASIARTASNRIRATIRVQNLTPSSRTIEAARDCPVVVVAYRSRADRDAVPARTGNWSGPPCRLFWQPFELAAGAQREFTYEFPIDVLSLAASTYFFTTIMHTERRSIVLSAGEVTIS